MCWLKARYLSQPLEAFQALEGKDKEAGLDLCGASHQEFITMGNLEQKTGQR